MDYILVKKVSIKRKTVPMVFILIILSSLLFGQINPPEVPTFEANKLLLSNTNQFRSVGPASSDNNKLVVHENELKRQKAKIQMMKEVYREVRKTTVEPIIKYNLPSYVSIPSTAYYKTAFSDLREMASDDSYSVGRANFLVENAFYENQKNYE